MDPMYRHHSGPPNHHHNSHHHNNSHHGQHHQLSHPPPPSHGGGGGHQMGGGGGYGQPPPPHHNNPHSYPPPNMTGGPGGGGGGGGGGRGSVNPGNLSLLNNGQLPQESKLMAYINSRGPPPPPTNNQMDMAAKGMQGMNLRDGGVGTNNNSGIQNGIGLNTSQLTTSSSRNSSFSTSGNFPPEFIPNSSSVVMSHPPPPGGRDSSASNHQSHHGHNNSQLPSSAGLRQPNSYGSLRTPNIPPPSSAASTSNNNNPNNSNNNLAVSTAANSVQARSSPISTLDGSTASAAVAVTSASATPASTSMDPATISSYEAGGAMYFYSEEEMALQGGHMPHHQMANGVGGGSVVMPDFSTYSGTPSHVANMKVKANTPGFMAESELKMDILRRQQICLSQLDTDSYPNLPTEVDNFTGLCPLEHVPTNAMLQHKSSTFGYATTVYKATNMKTGQHVCLRRIHGYRLVNTKCMVLVEQWKKLTHSNLVSLRQVFTTKSFGDHSMVFVYDLFPGAETLNVKHFGSGHQSSSILDPFSGTENGARPYSQQKNQLLRQQALLSQQNGGGSSSSGLLSESLIWTYIIQLTSALRHVHSSGLACRTLEPSKILVVNKTRLLLNCGGIFDVITFDPSSSNPTAHMANFQQEDLISLGKIVLALACNSYLAIQRENLQTSMEIVSTTYSSDLRNLIMYLLTNPQRVKSVNDLMPMIGARFYTQLDAALVRNDVVEAELAKEVESARLFRLLTKLSTVVDRAELNGDYSWSEYGDRYMLKLFRDYVFHQVMEDSRPWLDMSHIVSCLNKMDAGAMERVCLMSRDEQNVIVVSYAELKHCLEQSFAECVSATKYQMT